MKKILVIVLAILFLKTAARDFCLAQTSASEMQRTQEILEKEKTLREQLAKPEKFYVKKIIVQGSKLLLEEEIEYLISPFQKHWLTKQNIQQLLNIIKEAYKQKGAGQPADISYQIKNKCLKIIVEE